jgi:hypothetical protein
MIFVDRENLAIRYGAQLKARNDQPPSHVAYRQDIYVWTSAFRVNTIQGGGIAPCRPCAIVRQHGVEPVR